MLDNIKMNQIKLIYVYRSFGLLSILFLASSFFIEMDFLSIRNDDEFMITSLILAAISLAIFFIAIFWKIHLYKSTSVEKVIMAIGILFLIFIFFILLFIFSYNLPMMG